MTSIGLTVTGTIAGGATLNPIILGSISGTGVLILGYVSNSNIITKTSLCRFAYTSHEKILIEIETYLRGVKYDENVF